MSSKNDPNKKHYFQEITIDESHQFFKKYLAQSQNREVTIWEKGEDETAAEHYVAQSYETESRTLSLKATGSLALKVTGSSKTNKMVLIKMPYENLHFFGVGKLEFVAKELKYLLHFEGLLFKGQQRSNVRLDASDVIQIQLKIDQEVFDCLDISAGGTCFKVSPDQIERFQKDKIFEHSTLRFNRVNYPIPECKVAQHWKISDGIKIGIQFTKLSRETKDDLALRVSVEARGEEMKKKFDQILKKDSPS